ncbi:unnamed protein product [Medioppia subpectinata]|uniref:Telomere length regulation protein conserved domain-containing protein n=1 Tax=Medioppia subpectinata TaxID=1979941 RepID=A0A7R9KWL2_9ACAR|nr:unnamed protein product [Medioppia subpectinata]CAG2111185.1 unnamed protein product [Medioppia subpectinata]
MTMNETNGTSVEETIRKSRQMIDSLNGLSFADNKSAEEEFDDHFLSPEVNVFVILVHSFGETKENSFKRNKLLSLMTRYVYCDQTLRTLLTSTCRMSSHEWLVIGPKVETILVTIPEIVSNHMKTNVCHKFDRNLYFKRIVQTIWLCFEDVFEMIAKSIDSSVQLLSSLLGRISLIGFSNLVFNEVVIKMIAKCEKDFIWRRIAYKAFVSQQKPQYIEFKSDQILINIFGYLSNNCLHLFFESFENVLNSWSNSSAIKYRSYSQHLYLSRALMIGSRFMKDTDFSEVVDKFRRLTMNGIELHLKNSQTDFRNIGLTVGQSLMSLFYTENNEIHFEIEENDEIKHLNDLFLNNCNEKDLANIGHKLSTLKTSDDSEEIVPKVSVEREDKNLDSDDDDDSDLIPYDMSTESLSSVAKRPVYLRDCMEGLIDHEKVEWFTACLQNAEQIIRNNSDSVDGICVEFTLLLFRLDDTCAVDDFIGLRLRAMIALCVCSPKPVSNFLCEQFYASNYTIRQRLDVLEVLLASSTELSSNVKPNVDKMNPKANLLATHEEKIADNHWTQIVKNRIESKTRVLAHKTKTLDEKAFVNRFIPFAGHFFFPLMKNIFGNEIKVHFQEDDDYVLGRLLYTLGLILKNASFAPISKQMGKELLEFIIAFRYHSSVYVREAVIFAFCMVLMSVPPIYLINEMSLQMVELQLWLNDVTQREANSQCVQKALTALKLLKEVVNEMPFNSLFEMTIGFKYRSVHSMWTRRVADRHTAGDGSPPELIHLCRQIRWR